MRAYLAPSHPVLILAFLRGGTDLWPTPASCPNGPDELRKKDQAKAERRWYQATTGMEASLSGAG